VRHEVIPFGGGSDHYILSDPTVGVPTPMLNQWPDRFYHTSEDTLDKVDPSMLARIGSLAAAFAYAVACAGEREATWLGHEIVAQHECRLTQRTQNVIHDVLTAGDGQEIARLFQAMGQAAAYRAECDKAALASLVRLWPDAGKLARELGRYLDDASQREVGRVEALCRQRAVALTGAGLPQPAGSDAPWQQSAENLVPRRLYRGPIAFLSVLDGGTPEERDTIWEANRQAGEAWVKARTLAEYWIDGKRTLAEVAALVRQETGANVGPEILAYCELLASKGLLALHPTASPEQQAA
jgi:hypothetical protein